jgi:hypothetical protein
LRFGLPYDRIHTVRQNQRIIPCDAHDPPSTWNVSCHSAQVAALDAAILADACVNAARRIMTELLAQRAGVPRLVLTGEPINGADVVVWYGNTETKETKNLSHSLSH